MKDWREEAKCRGQDMTSVFYPDEYITVFRTKEAIKADLKAACRFCLGCPVQQECLDWALVHEKDFGVWGGMTAPQRRTEVKRRQYQRRPDVELPPHGTWQRGKVHQRLQEPACKPCREALNKYQFELRTFTRRKAEAERRQHG